MIVKKQRFGGLWLFWLFLAVLSILLRWYWSFYPEHAESFYSRGCYPYVRWILDHSWGLLPFPWLYLLVPYFVYQIIKHLRRWSPWQMLRSGRWLKSVIGWSSIVVVWFLWGWGYNYNRLPVQQSLYLPEITFDSTHLREELRLSAHLAILHRAAIADAKNQPLNEHHWPANLEEAISIAVRATLSDLGYQARHPVPLRVLHPKGWTMRVGAAGFYLPWTGECHVDAALHPVQLPAVMAHEMCHAYGFGDEGTCNFLAELALMRSNHAVLRYSGALSWYRSVASRWRFYYPESYENFREALPVGMQADLNAINEVLKAYPELFPAARDAIYETYLKSQGVEKGMESYQDVIALMPAFRKSLYGHLWPVWNYKDHLPQPAYK